MKQGENKIYTFGEIQVDQFQQSVKRKGEELHLRQKSFEVLVYLLHNRDRLVTKEELIENIWKVAAVTDDVVVQSIVEIRKAIGEEARQPRFLKTVPKVGYRFIGAVEEGFAEKKVVQVEKITTYEFEVEEEVPELPSGAGGHKQLEAPARRKRLGFLVIPAVVLLAAVSFYAGYRTFVLKQDSSITSLPDHPGKKTLAVAFFDNLSGDPELDWLREGLADMLITNLSRSRQLTLLGRQQFHLILERIGHRERENIRLDEALEIARRSKAQAIVLGGFSRAGNQMRIDTQLYDARNGQLIATDHLLIERPEEILTNIDLLSLKIASHLGVTPAGPNVEMSHVMTNDLDAYRYYSLAVEKAHGLHNTEAIELLEKAIAIDPQFAMAHARIGYAYAVTWNLTEQAKPHLQKAFQLSDRLTAKDKLYITAWYALANHDFSSAISSFRRIVKDYPFELEAYTRLAKLHQGEGHYQEAIDTFRQGLVIDPEAADIHNGLGLLYSALGRHQEAMEMHQKYLQLSPREPNAHDSLGLTYQAAGLYPQAIEQYHLALALDPDFEVAVVHLGNAYFQLGRYRDAIRQFQRYVQIAPSELERSRGLDCIAYIHWRMGDLPMAERTLNLETQSRSLVTKILVAIDRGEKERAQELMAQFSQYLAGRGARLESRLYLFSAGYSRMKMDQKKEAIEVFQNTLRSLPPYWHLDTYEDCLANAYLATGQTDEAIAEYRRILKLNPNYPLAHFHLAQAYEADGRPDLARAAYEEFLRVWNDADPDLPQIKTALDRLSRLAMQSIDENRGL